MASLISDQLTKSQRLLKIAELLRGQALTVRDIALMLSPKFQSGSPGWSATLRAIQRDLTDLELLEPDLTRTNTRPPRYCIPVKQSHLHPTEALMLHAAARAIYHRSSGEKIHHRAALKRLTSSLPAHLRPVMERSFADVGEKREAGQETLNLEKAAAAWLGAHPLAFEYQKPGGSGAWRPNVVETYLIELHPQNLELYLIGRETTFHRDVRTFKLARMRTLQVLMDRHYTIPATFDPRAFFQSAYGVVGAQDGQEVKIRLRFRADAAYRVLEGSYSHLEDMKKLPDDRVEATAQAAPDSSGLPREVLAWIYSFGPRVEVLGPPEIRAHWLTELREAVNNATTDVAEMREDEA